VKDVTVKKKCPPAPSMTMAAIHSREWRAKRLKAGGEKVKCNPVQTELDDRNDEEEETNRRSKRIMDAKDRCPISTRPSLSSTSTNFLRS